MSTKDRGVALIFPFVFVLQGDREAEQGLAKLPALGPLLAGNWS